MLVEGKPRACRSCGVVHVTLYQPPARSAPRARGRAHMRMHWRWLFSGGRRQGERRGRRELGSSAPDSAADHVSKIENRGSSVPIAYSLTPRTQHVGVADGRDRALYVEITV